MTSVLTMPQEMFFVILTMLFLAALVSDLRNATIFRSFRNRPSPWKALAKDTQVVVVVLVVFMAWAQDKDDQQSVGGGTAAIVSTNSAAIGGEWLSGTTLDSMEGGYYSLPEPETGIAWALRSGCQPFASNAVLTIPQFQAGFACVSVTNIQSSALDAPEDAVVYTNWPYAVARHAVLLPQGCLPPDFLFGGRSVTNLYAAASGMLAFDGPKSSPQPATNGIPDGSAADYISVLQTPSDIVPPEGILWYVSGTNSSLFTWKDVYLGQDTNCTATVQAELFANGDFTCRYLFPSLTNSYAQVTNAFLIGAQNNFGGETVLHTNSLLAIHPSFFPAFELRWKSLAGIDPEVPDQDGDGLTTANELFLFRTEARNPDSDGDGLTDGEEVNSFSTDPNAFSSDSGGTGDLWRVVGGLTPADAPDTTAAPSASVGILTVTTRLDDAPPGGGAILRIAGNYIPVLSGTTLVSRIALPRDTTNLFILARGVNCDNAVAQVTLEASSFTKIRDPEGALDGSFTLSPSCVTASGTLFMPSYTITPAVYCPHSPTSSVCRITSADTDLYFSTGQGLVREYSPALPTAPVPFTNDVVELTLACMDTTLSVLSASTNVQAHLCGGDWDTDDYPDDPHYDEWCRIQNGVHTHADGYNETNCPCLLDCANVYDCLCPHEGRTLCACAHPVSDPKAMPESADYTNVLGHAVLVIGGTNDHLHVSVPEGTYRPCTLCGCARGTPSSASVYRQTDCISVTPGTLITNGAFSVAGISPSTNFADTVFMYRLRDYSNPEAFISYIRKDYTVLGTAVYPADPGHSVSNWFIGCNVTNALTLWTGIKLPSDTGDVSLSVTVESGTPSPQLYVYNRTAQSNELLVTQGQLAFTQNLGDWRSTYCDTNGYAQASLLCTSGGVARVSHSYETYSGQPQSISCLSEQKFTSSKADLDIRETVQPQNRVGRGDPRILERVRNRILVWANNGANTITFDLIKPPDINSPVWVQIEDQNSLNSGLPHFERLDLSCATFTYTVAEDNDESDLLVRYGADINSDGVLSGTNEIYGTYEVYGVTAEEYAESRNNYNYLYLPFGLTHLADQLHKRFANGAFTTGGYQPSATGSVTLAATRLTHYFGATLVDSGFITLGGRQYYAAIGTFPLYHYADNSDASNRILTSDPLKDGLNTFIRTNLSYSIVASAYAAASGGTTRSVSFSLDRAVFQFGASGDIGLGGVGVNSANPYSSAGTLILPITLSGSNYIIGADAVVDLTIHDLFDFDYFTTGFIANYSDSSQSAGMIQNGFDKTGSTLHAGQVGLVEVEVDGSVTVTERIITP